VITAPAIVGNLVVVRTADGRLYGLDSSTGERRWAYDQTAVPTLSLRGNGPLLVANGVVFFGSDNGKLVALRMDNGEKLWEQGLSSGEGRTEIDRLNDADGAVVLDGSTLFAAAYHGQLTAVDGPSGRPLWNRPFSSYTSIDVHGNAVYGVDEQSNLWAFDKSGGADMWKQEQGLSSGEGRTEIDRLNDADGAVVLDGSTLFAAAYHGQLSAVDGPSGRPLWNRPFSSYTSIDVHGNAVYGVDEQSNLWAFDKSGGADMWKQDALKYRWLTGPAAQGEYIVVGDLEGYVHWLASADGKLVARERLSKKAIRSQPVVVGNTVYVEDVEGHIGAYRIAAP